MTDIEQKQIFARNLNKYISLNQKQQVDVAKDLGINPTTLNMWCNGKSMPGTGKIRKLADYFGIGITNLTDEKEETDMNIQLTQEELALIENYRNLDKHGQSTTSYIIEQEIKRLEELNKKDEYIKKLKMEIAEENLVTFPKKFTDAKKAKEYLHSKPSLVAMGYEKSSVTDSDLISIANITYENEKRKNS